jgi:hypothetical protein
MVVEKITESRFENEVVARWSSPDLGGVVTSGGLRAQPRVGNAASF